MKAPLRTQLPPKTPPQNSITFGIKFQLVTFEGYKHLVHSKCSRKKEKWLGRDYCTGSFDACWKRRRNHQLVIFNSGISYVSNTEHYHWKVTMGMLNSYWSRELLDKGWLPAEKCWIMWEALPSAGPYFLDSRQSERPNSIRIRLCVQIIHKFKWQE